MRQADREPEQQRAAQQLRPVRPAIPLREQLDRSSTEGQRVELMGDGVRTMLVCPGYVKTGFQKNVRAGQAPERVLNARRFAITAEQCALAIRRGVERDARMVVTPRSGWAVIWLRRFFPAIVDRRLSRMQERQS